jgi:putative hydrolase of the HAD superfamily
MTAAGVLFDFSATLFDPRRVVDGAALARHAERRGAVIGEPAAASLARRILERAESPWGREARAHCDLSPAQHRAGWVRVAASVSGVDDRIAEAFHDCITDPPRWRPYPDTAGTLRALRARGTGIAVVSNCGWDLRDAFRAAGLHDLIDVYVLSCEHGRQKPDPDLFARACAGLGIRSSQALMVGDDPAADSGALGAGIAVHLLPAPAPYPAPRGLAAVLPLCGAAPAGHPTPHR